MNKHIKPTDSELEILQVLWQKKEATVRSVHETIVQTKDCGYTTTLKLMQIMYDKGLVTRNDEKRTHVFKPAITQQQTQQQFLHKMIDTLYNGSSTNLVLQALGDSKPNQDELQQIEKLIQQLKQQK